MKRNPSFVKIVYLMERYIIQENGDDYWVKDTKYNIYFFSKNYRKPSAYFLPILKRTCNYVYELKREENRIVLSLLDKKDLYYCYNIKYFYCELIPIKMNSKLREIIKNKTVKKLGHYSHFVMDKKQEDRLLGLPDETEVILVNEHKNHFMTNMPNQYINEAKIILLEDKDKFLNKMENRYNIMIANHQSESLNT